MKKQLLLAAVAFALLSAPVQAAPWSPPADKPMWATGVEEMYDASRPITIYHLEGRRSQRIAWLCEELGIPYNLVYRRGNVGGSSQIIQDLPIRIAFAPTIHYKGRYMFESGAILAHILDEFGEGRLRPAETSPDYPIYLQWLHFAEGAGMSRFYRDQTLLDAEGFSRFQFEKLQAEGKIPKTNVSESKENLDFMEAYLQNHDYFGGAEFSIADIMIYWIWERGTVIAGIDQTKYPKFNAWAKRVNDRPAYQAAMLRVLPDNQPDQCRLQCTRGSESLPGSPIKPGKRP